MKHDRARDSLHALVTEAAERARIAQALSQTLIADHAVLHDTLQKTLAAIDRGRETRRMGSAEGR